MSLLISFVWVVLCSHKFVSGSKSIAHHQYNEIPAYPIVLVHGLIGWEREVFPDYPYWGKEHGDYAQMLAKAGHEVYVANIGPFSSNWDRACELYAAVKGGQVDYGQGHANKYMHNQLGRKYEGLYPKWGEKDAFGSIYKVHFIGHSMGGSTVRMLSHLLAYGAVLSGDEVKSMVDKTHPFYDGGRDWIESITFLESPLHGTLTASTAYPYQSAVVALLRAAVSVVGTVIRSNASFDAHLDQWKVDSLDTFKLAVDRWIRPGNSEQDTALYSLSTKGAAEENIWIRESPNIFYFVYTTGHGFEVEGTWPKLKCQCRYERVIQQGYIIQALNSQQSNSNSYSESKIEPNWGCSNDAAVETASMTGNREFISLRRPLDLRRGKWHRFAHFPFLYHSHMTGKSPDIDFIDLLKAHASVLEYISKSATREHILEGETKELLFINLEKAIEKVEQNSKKFACKFLPQLSHLREKD
ncbi:hypothetical protein ABG067_004077 [Albugo candida]